MNLAELRKKAQKEKKEDAVLTVASPEPLTLVDEVFTQFPVEPLLDESMPAAFVREEYEPDPVAVRRELTGTFDPLAVL
ncbi:MAG TPA: hypothetical protein VEM32_09140, partial [Geobacteraceae bacterium]|nr:hypothetical protein [Geobacteraceae bacterium]